MTAVDRPDNGQDERDRVFADWYAEPRGQMSYPIAFAAGWDAALTTGRAGAGEQQRDTDEDCGHHSWTGLMALLDEHWPADIFPTREDDITRDAGARIVSLLRWVDRLGGPQPDGEAVDAVEAARACWCAHCEGIVLAADHPTNWVARIGGRRFIVCRDCGDKRCPRAAHHDRPCAYREPCRVYSHGADGWHCAVEGPHDQHHNAAGTETW